MSGRVRGITVASGGAPVYVGSANGGVWRSDDAGVTWRSLMDAWDQNPTRLASDSLSCGAIAIDPTAPDRIFVGTGEGFGAYFGVGPVVSVDGGANWSTEPSSAASGSWNIAASVFFALAVDPGNTARVLAATSYGLYRREPTTGGFQWDKKVLGALTGGGQRFITSVVAARSGAVTTFYAAPYGGPVSSSTDGATWTVVGTGFPTNGGRIGLAVRPTDPTVVYALLTDFSTGGALGVWRLNTSDNTWRQVTGHPAALFGTPGYYQGLWDLAIAVDPNDAARVYLGGSTVFGSSNWCAALYRCAITSTGSGTTLAFSMTPTFIGSGVHADVHAIVFAPGDSNKLWVGCDGGAFFSTNPTTTATFVPRNTGLQTLTLNHLGQHPSEDAVLFGGTQDNGVARFTGEEAWYHSFDGDSGHCVVNWSDPYRVLATYVNHYLFRTTDGGVLGNWSSVPVPIASGEASLFYAPLVGTPPNPSTPAEAEIVAFGSVRPWITTDFGTTWKSIPNNTLAGDSLIGPIRSLAFASATKLYAGTRSNPATGVGNGGVYRFDKSGTTWSATRLDNVAAGALGVVAPVTSIAVDLSDATGNSIYVTLGGNGDYRHVWRFNGTQWQQRSGATAGGASSLLDVQANAIVVDAANTAHLYVGADIGVWRSTDSGATWSPFSSGLPDAAVLDLDIHAGRRLLRATTHGRGVFEWQLDVTSPPAIELYVRDTQLDQGRFTTVNWLPDPVKKGAFVRHWAGPDIRLDTPDTAGTYQFPATGSIDFLQFTDELSDDFENVATHATATITTRVYVQVHNRGMTPANGVQVMLLLANASAGLPPLPSNYDVNVRNGMAVTSAAWKTLGFFTLNDVRVGFPKIARFDLSSSLLPKSANLAGNAHHCVLALLHHPSDQFMSTTTVTDTLSLTERKAAHKNLTVVGFTGTVPPAAPPLVVPVEISDPDPEGEAVLSLQVDPGAYPGRIRVFAPRLRLRADLERSLSGGAARGTLSDFARWATRYRRETSRAIREGAVDSAWSRQRLEGIDAVLGTGMAIALTGKGPLRLDGIVLRRGEVQTLFVAIDRPRVRRTGSYLIEVSQRRARDERWSGGLDIRVDVMPKPATRRRGAWDAAGD